MSNTKKDQPPQEERRSGKDRRHINSPDYSGPDRRKHERRSYDQD